MRWSTSVISPPTGDLRAYLASLRLVAERPEHTYWPTHGPAVRDPQEYVPALADHRDARTRQILDVLAAAPATIREIVGACYPGLDDRLVRAAGRSVFAHLLGLRVDGWVASFPGDDAVVRWRLVAA
jgi:glyoxylase-like metal-dependent hydrolase (beta-lactamase superfamily II)